jgi:hypothetical protein
MLCGVSYTYHIIYVYGLILSVDSSRLAAAGLQTSVDAVLDAVLVAMKYAPLQYSTYSRPSSMFSSRQSKCSRVWKYFNVLVCRLATLCRFDFAKLQREWLHAAAKKQPLTI